jgi:uncharacterized protein (DUF58 family)
LKNLKDISEFRGLASIEFLARQVVEGFITGLHKSPFHGFSVEFAEHRLYNTGESTKNIDWKLYAKTDRLFTKRYEEETNLRSRIIIDVSSSMLFPNRKNEGINKLLFSVYSAAALVHLLKKQRDAVGITLFSDKVESHTESKTSGVHITRLYAMLEQLTGKDAATLNKRTSPADLLHETADKLHKRSLIIIFSDMFSADSEERIFSALNHMKHNKHEIILFHVTDKQHEYKFDYQNFPHKFVDMETGESIKLNPNDIKTHFEQNSSEFYTNLKLKCGQYKIDFVEADINAGFDEVLLPYLFKRKKLL